jgi:hypothetical protein
MYNKAINSIFDIKWTKTSLISLIVLGVIFIGALIGAGNSLISFGFLIGTTLLSITILNSTWLVSGLYPATWFLGQLPLTIGNLSLSL